MNNAKDASNDWMRRTTSGGENVEAELPAEVSERVPILLVDDRPSNLLSLKAILE